jgi:hypothetical protein
MSLTEEKTASQEYFTITMLGEMPRSYEASDGITFSLDNGIECKVFSIKNKSINSSTRVLRIEYTTRIIRETLKNDLICLQDYCAFEIEENIPSTFNGYIFDWHTSTNHLKESINGILKKNDGKSDNCESLIVNDSQLSNCVPWLAIDTNGFLHHINMPVLNRNERFYASSHKPAYVNPCLESPNATDESGYFVVDW